MGTDRHENLHYLPRIFKGQTEGRTGHRKRTRCFYENSVPISGRADSRTTKLLQRKDNSPGSPSTSPSFGCVTALGTEGPISVSGLGNINPIPFRSAARQNTSMVFAFGRVSLRNGFLRYLRNGLTHVHCVSHGNLLQLQSSRLSLEYLLYHHSICRWRAQAAHARHLKSTPPPPPPPRPTLYHCGVKPPRGKLCRSGPGMDPC
ncbi:hypothetical protein JTE90_023059 [Oedothorax gibbosus]|uniref:Uncharacterized protein n=1 Tax=Oedothorax gibbosus TaxID=931172 RepID=A0AAV6TJ83_9ARAC|nr:hypothetical protein JTE90_023059 [Oedothorax gibbosus]